MKQITWGELKKKVEQAGVEDSDKINCIDIDGLVGETIQVIRENYEVIII